MAEPISDPVRQLAEIDVRWVTVGGNAHLEASTDNSTLFPQFYAFALSVADAIQVDGLSPPKAVDRSLGRWRELLRPLRVLGEEQQVGLLGELWVLARLVSTKGEAGLAAWTGPRREAHDFRLGDYELEVKTTRSQQRSHVIESLGQLVASPDKTLHLVSVQVAAAGADGGFSIASEIEAIWQLLSKFGSDVEFASLLLAGFEMTLEDAKGYEERFQLRSRPRLITVTSDFPSLRPDDLERKDRFEMARVYRVQYHLDVSGLGWPDGTPEFFDVLPMELEADD